jgi:phenylacetate-coenzyme A ligase PaaK-like adenylate-forming protein
MMITRLFWSAFTAFHLRGQADLPYKSLSRIERDRDRRVRQMVAYAYRYVPFYRKTMNRLGLRPSDFRGADDLEKLPLVDREQVQYHFKDFLSRSKFVYRFLEVSSGGSTGAPVKVRHDIRSLFLNAAHGERDRAPYLSLLGKNGGYRQTLLSPGNFGTAHKIQMFCRKHALYPKGKRINRQYLSLLDPPEENLQKINAFQPDIICSYGSYLEMLFNYIEKTGKFLHRPKAVVYGGDGMSHNNRQLIETKHRIPVFSTYGAVEALKIGFECNRHIGLHVNIDLYPLRIIDDQGEALPDGHIGHVVVSNLINRGTVLLNYRLGDRAAYLSTKCPCGCSLPLLSFPDGRMDDIIKLKGGRMRHPQAVRTIFTEEQEVQQYQVVQQTHTSFIIKIVTKKEGKHPALKNRITRKFVKSFGDDITVDISIVNALERTPMGKIRPVISMIDNA